MLKMWLQMCPVLWLGAGGARPWWVLGLIVLELELGKEANPGGKHQRWGERGGKVRDDVKLIHKGGD